MDGTLSENNRLRKELKANQIAYAKLNNEKDEAITALMQAHEKITQLKSVIKLKEQLLMQVREEKEKEIAELEKINKDLEMRLRSALEFDVDGALNFNVSNRPPDATSFGQGIWGQSSSEQSQISFSEALVSLQEWEGVSGLVGELKKFQEEEECEKHVWKPGTQLNTKWKPNIKVYVSAQTYLLDIIEMIQTELFPQLDGICRQNSVSLSLVTPVSEQLEEFLLPAEVIKSASCEEIKSSDIFIALLGARVNDLSKSEVEYGFLNNPNIRPTVFVFINGPGSDVNSNKLKQRVRNSGHCTNIIDCNMVASDVLDDLYDCIFNILKQSFYIHEPPNTTQEATLKHLTLLADQRIEYEQRDTLEKILHNVPPNPSCIDLTIENLRTYMSEKGTVAPYLITAPTGSGKSVLLAKWVEILERDYHADVSVMYHFVTRSCSSTSDICLMYRRFCHKLLLLYDAESNGASLAVDPDSQEDMFSELLNKTAAMLEQSTTIFFIIDNAELLQDHTQLAWLHKPLPKNVRVVMTTNDTAHYPDSWKHLASCSIPSPNGSDLQQVLPTVLYGNQKRKLTDDQVISLAIVSQYSFLWCIIAAKYILSISDKQTETETDESISALEDITDIPELVKVSVDEMESMFPSLIIATEQILQLIYFSRNGLTLSELQQLLQFPDVIICFVINELKNRYILYEIAGILQFTHESVLEFIQYKYHLDSSPENLLIWSETLIQLFSDLKNQVLFRCTEELPWLLKRGEMQQDLANVLLNIDILIHMYSSGQGALLLQYWRWIGILKDSIPEQYKYELSAVDDHAGNDESSAMYVAMVMLTVGKILRNLGLLEETQPLLQRALELYESHCDPDSDEIANVFCELALLYVLMKKYSAAECYYNQALDIYEDVCGECSDQAIHVLEGLKRVYNESKKPELLDSISTRLLSLREQRRKSKPSVQTIIMKHMEALETFLNQFEGDQLPNDDYVRCLNEWAVLHAAFGHDSLADNFFYTALSTSEDVLGEEHSQTLSILKNWTILYTKMNKLSDALIIQGRIVEIKEKLSEYDTNFAAALNNLAVLHGLNNNYKEAVAYFDKSIELYVSHYGHEHSKVLETMENRKLASQKILELSF